MIFNHSSANIYVLLLFLFKHFFSGKIGYSLTLHMVEMKTDWDRRALNAEPTRSGSTTLN